MGRHIQGKSIVSLSKLAECFTLFRNPRFEYSALVSINCLVRYCTLCLLCYSEISRTNVWRNILMLLFLSCREIAASSCWMNFREHWEISRSFLSFSVKGTFLFSILCCRNTWHRCEKISLVSLVVWHFSKDRSSFASRILLKMCESFVQNFAE